MRQIGEFEANTVFGRKRGLLMMLKSKCSGQDTYIYFS